MTRYRLLALLLSAPALSAKSKLGDAAWMRNFSAFLQAINRFVLAMNDDRLDLQQWERVQRAWRLLG